MNISGLGNTYNGINTNSKQYKALKEKGWLSGIMQNEAMMSSEERMFQSNRVEVHAGHGRRASDPDRELKCRTVAA